MPMVRLFGLGRPFCIPLQIFPPRKTGYFPVWKIERTQTFFQLENKAKFEMEETVQAQMYKHNLSVFHRYKWMWIYSVLAIRKICMTVSSWTLRCLVLHDTGEEEKAWWEFKGGSGNWRAVFSEATNNFRCLHVGIFFHK